MLTFRLTMSFRLLWQASFDPPGLSVAVKKDRAAEPLLVTGARFVVNVLASGHERNIIKALSKPFAPGQDRFADLEIVVRLSLQPLPGKFTHCKTSEL